MIENQNPYTPAIEVESVKVKDETPVQEIIVQEPKAVEEAKEVKKSFLETLAEKKMEEIQKLNPEFKLDFMSVFTRMKINTKGQFIYTLSGDETILSDKIDVRLLGGEYIYQYWGEKGTEDEGELLCYSKDRVTNCDGGKCTECPHDPDNCKIRYALVMNIYEKDEDPEEIFNINIPSTGTFAFADYVKLLNKKHKKGVAEVITNMHTKEKTGADDAKIKYNAVLFEFSKNQNKLDKK